MGNRPSKNFTAKGKQLGKQTGRKAGRKAKKTGKKLSDKVLGFLKKILFQKPVNYVKVAAKNQYLKVKNKTVDLVTPDQVPKKHRTDNGRQQVDDKRENGWRRSGRHSKGRRSKKNRPKNFDRKKDRQRQNKRKRKPQGQPRLNGEMMKQGRESTLKGLTNEETARRANKYDKARQDVLQNPQLIGANSEWEAKLKLKLARGEDIQAEIDSNSKISEAQVAKILGNEWMARWGYNQHGDELTDKLSDKSGKDEGGDGKSGKKGKGKKRGDGKGQEQGRSQSGDGGVPNTEPANDWGMEDLIGRRSGEPLNGAGKGSIDTDAGETDIDVVSPGGKSSSSGSGSSSGSSGGGESGSGLAASSGDGLASSPGLGNGSGGSSE